MNTNYKEKILASIKKLREGIQNDEDTRKISEVISEYDGFNFGWLEKEINNSPDLTVEKFYKTNGSFYIGNFRNWVDENKTKLSSVYNDRAKKIEELKKEPAWNNLTGDEKRGIEEKVLDEGLSFKKAKKEVEEIGGTTTPNKPNKNKDDYTYAGSTITGSKKPALITILFSALPEGVADWDKKDHLKFVISENRVKKDLFEKHLTEGIAEGFFTYDDKPRWSEVEKWLNNNKELLNGSLEEEAKEATERTKRKEAKDKVREAIKDIGRENWNKLSPEERDEIRDKAKNGASLEEVKKETEKKVEEVKNDGVREGNDNKDNNKSGRGEYDPKENKKHSEVIRDKDYWSNVYEPKVTKIAGSGIEIYNELFSQGKSPILRRFEQLLDLLDGREQDIDEHENQELVKKMDDKLDEMKKFRFLSLTDDLATKQEIHRFNGGELKKREEMSELMEQLIKEMETKNSATASSNQDDYWSREYKPMKEEEIRKIREKAKKNIDEVTSLLTESEDKNTYDEISVILKKLEKYHGENAFYERYGEIEQLGIKLFKLDKNRYFAEYFGKEVKNDDSASDGNKFEEFLTEEDKTEINSFKNDENKGAEEVIAKKEEISVGVKNRMINKEFEEYLDELEIKEGPWFKSVNDDYQTMMKGIMEAEKKITRYQWSSNVFENNAYVSNEAKAQAFLAKARSASNSFKNNKNNQTDNKGFFQPKVLVPVVLAAVVLVGLMVMVVRSRRRKEK